MTLPLLTPPVPTSTSAVSPTMLAVGAAAAVLALLGVRLVLARAKVVAFRLALSHLAFAAIGGVGVAAFEQYLPAPLASLVDGLRWVAAALGIPV